MTLREDLSSHYDAGHSTSDTPKALSKIILKELEVAYYIHNSTRNGKRTKKPRLIVHFYSATKAILDSMFGPFAGYRLSVSESGEGDCRIIRITPYKDREKGVHIRRDGDGFVLSTSIPYSRKYRKHPQMPMGKVQLSKSYLRLTTLPKKDWPKKATKSKRRQQKETGLDIFNDQKPDDKKQKFKRGDQVVVKGSPETVMVVLKVFRTQVTCQWNTPAGKPYERTYHQDVLEFAPSKKK